MTHTFTYKDTLIACYLGYITQAIVNNLAPLLFIIFQDQFAISFEQIGRLILINFGTQIAADILTLRYADRIGHRRVLVTAHVMSAAGLIGLAIFPHIFPSPYMGLVAAVVIYAIGGGIIEVMVSPVVESLPGDAKASAMSLLHSFYCWGQMGVVLITTLLIWAMGGELWFLLPVLWAAVPLYNLVRFLKVPLMPLPPHEEKMSIGSLFNSRIFLIALVLMVCAASSELTMSQWSSLFAEKGLQVPKLVGDIMGPFLFAAFMGTGRLLFGFWGHRINLNNALLVSGLLCVGCYLVTVFASNPVVALLACALTGLSVALMWPGTFSAGAAAFPRGGTVMFGLLAVFGDLGAATGPWIAGLTSDVAQASQRLMAWSLTDALTPEQLGLKAGLLVTIIFPILFVAGILLLRREPSPSLAETAVLQSETI
jgi:fucose permease